MAEAKLITPEGATIVLPSHVYTRVMEMLAVDQPPREMTKEELNQVIRETRGSWKVKGRRPLTEALLESRREELEREERKIREQQHRIVDRNKRAT